MSLINAQRLIRLFVRTRPYVFEWVCYMRRPVSARIFFSAIQKSKEFSLSQFIKHYTIIAGPSVKYN